ncbi:MAG: VCBS repeat-containing protein [Verrucomicrobia bacterium]|nr:VCBS repeat-containing protein [Verrucomicrobiota bacterium]
MRPAFEMFFRTGLVVLALACHREVHAAIAGNLAWQSGQGFRFAELAVSSQGKTGFTLLPPGDTGIVFTNRLSNVTVAKNRLTEIGSGVALGDVDGDGRADVYLCGLDGGNGLYRNLGHWEFEDITAKAGVACPTQLSTGCAFADVDGDGDLDLLVNILGGGTRIFLNDGQGRFTESNAEWPARRLGATSLALADVDGNGHLDLYVTNYRSDTFHDNLAGLKITTGQLPGGTTIVDPRDRFLGLKTSVGGLEVLEKGEMDFLYVNRGGGRFLPVRWELGVFLDEDGKPLAGPTTDWGLSVIFRDLNGDGLPDLYVCNDFVNWPDRVWLNQGGKLFRAAPRNAFRCFSLSSMAVDVADINRDGHDDIFVADMLNPRRESRAWQRPDTLQGTVVWPMGDANFRPEVTRNTLHLARGDGTFAEIAQLAGVTATDWTWSVIFLDVDLDGWEDLLVATGNNHDVQDVDVIGEIVRSGGWKTPETRLQNLSRMPRREAPSLAFRNRRDLTFEDKSVPWGFGAVGIAHGMALADIDNDGDLDVVMNCLNAPARVYRNETAAPRLAVRLKGAGGNTRGIGAKITVSGGPVTQSQEMIAGGRYLSSDDPMRVFAAGDARRLEIQVAWRSGKRSFVKAASPNCVYEIDEAFAETPPDSVPRPMPPLFEEASSRLNHVHVDAPFNDFGRQPLLPRKLSGLGPGACWTDVNADGAEDLIVAGGNGGRTTIFHNDLKGGFFEQAASDSKANSRDQTSIVVWRASDGAPSLLSGQSNWEDADTNASPIRVQPLQATTGANQASVLGDGRSVVGPLAVADVDGDGLLEVFVGGRVVAGRYPEAASSYLLRWDGKGFQVQQAFPNLGLVSGTVFTDFDEDGDPDLALACEWDSVRLFRNDAGKFSEVTAALGLARFKGLWNGIAAGDFDGDGKLDFMATNWGRNWRTDQSSGANAPVHLFWGHFAGDSVIHTLLASNDPNTGKMLLWRERKAVASAIPSVGVRFPSHHTYGRATAQEILSDQVSGVREFQATTFESTLFLNRGDHFEARPLPIEAQFAPAFGVSVADFDGDGNEDAFLAQNFFGVDAETSRHDAGAGLVLLGDGRGGFRALRPPESGIAIYGEQRATAVADFDRDGRTDLVVTQNGGATKLFHNTGGKPGLRLRLIGLKGNPDGVGAVLRLAGRGRAGPAREVHAGSGYWSQDSCVQVMHLSDKPDEIRVGWPGEPEARKVIYRIPEGAHEVHLKPDGGIKVVPP